MLYTPVPGTPLYEQVEEEGRLLKNVDLADIHGQYKFNFKHPAISRDESKKFLDWAFWRDFERNGPSLYRICKTTLDGWLRYKNCPDLRVRERFQREAESLKALRSHVVGHGIARQRKERKWQRQYSLRTTSSTSSTTYEDGLIAGGRYLYGYKREEKRWRPEDYGAPHHRAPPWWKPDRR
jgi:hypothetical protein